MKDQVPKTARNLLQAGAGCPGQRKILPWCPGAWPELVAEAPSPALPFQPGDAGHHVEMTVTAYQWLRMLAA